MTAPSRIGIVILAYNSDADLPSCLRGLLAQKGIDSKIIVVDNASKPDSLALMENAFLAQVPTGKIFEVGSVDSTKLECGAGIFIRNSQNAGYSAGNNIGARLAAKIGCDAVLIVNPDVRVSNPRYIEILWNSMREDPSCAVAASRILGLSDAEENPIRELGFWEELLWIRRFGPSVLRPKSTVQPFTGTEPVEANKLNGCCFLIRSSFLEATNYLDENVFLYSEEPILAARVRAAGKRMMFFPQVEAMHIHIKSAKGNVSNRVRQSIKSRLYYIDRYSGYGLLARIALHFSYGVLSLLHAAKIRLFNHG